MFVYVYVYYKYYITDYERISNIEFGTSKQTDLMKFSTLFMMTNSQKNKRDAVSMLDHRLRCWLDIDPAFGQCILLLLEVS